MMTRDRTRDASRVPANGMFFLLHLYTVLTANPGGLLGLILTISFEEQMRGLTVHVVATYT
jgi:hypothetical protein